MLNPEVDLKAKAREYQERHRVVIDDFLDPSVAAEVKRSFSELERRALWYRVEHGDAESRDKDELSYRLWRFPLRNMKLSEVLQDSTRAAPPAPALERTPEEELSPSHPLRKLSDFLNSASCHEAIGQITDESITPGSIRCYGSQYLPGDYLGAHADERADKRIAFVLNLTQNWLSHWGGNLVVLDDRYERIVDTYMNRFNSIVLMKVPLPHAVLPVSIHSQVPRHAVSGWFRE